MQFVSDVVSSIESFVSQSDLKDWGLIATILVVLGYAVLRKVDGS